MIFRTLRADEIDARIGSIKKPYGSNKGGVSILLYKDARADMILLDETVGFANWQRTHEVINGNLFCNVGVKIDGEWIWKQDVGTESYTEKEKGQASDSFKRACVNWGIGRELYTAPFIWFSGDQCNITEDGKCFDSFEVTNIACDEDRNISELRVINKKTKSEFNWKSDKALAERTDDAKERAQYLKKINDLCEKLGITPAEYCAENKRKFDVNDTKLLKAMSEGLERRIANQK